VQFLMPTCIMLTSFSQFDLEDEEKNHNWFERESHKNVDHVVTHE
jgi:hypothetical protein